MSSCLVDFRLVKDQRTEDARRAAQLYAGVLHRCASSFRPSFYRDADARPHLISRSPHRPLSRRVPPRARPQAVHSNLATLSTLPPTRPIPRRPVPPRRVSHDPPLGHLGPLALALFAPQPRPGRLLGHLAHHIHDLDFDLGPVEPPRRVDARARVEKEQERGLPAHSPVARQACVEWTKLLFFKVTLVTDPMCHPPQRTIGGNRTRRSGSSRPSSERPAPPRSSRSTRASRTPSSACSSSRVRLYLSRVS